MPARAYELVIEPPRAWRPRAGALAADARAVACEVLARVASPARVLRAVRLANAMRSKGFFWDSASLATGFAGIALACAYAQRCNADADWGALARRALVIAASQLKRQAAQPGLFGGIAGVAFAGQYLSLYDESCSSLVAQSNQHLSRSLAGVAARAVTTQGISESSFDLVSGTVGVGAHLLGHEADAAVHESLERVLEWLVSLVAPDRDEPIPRWYTPPNLSTNSVFREQYPHGVLNLGLAHGIPGPLALLSLALLHDVEVPGQARAIDALAQWLIDHEIKTERGPDWPTVVPLQRDASGALIEAPDDFPARSAWCYGAPGVSTALLIAAKARQKDLYWSHAIAGMKGALARSLDQREIDSPTFCHGVSGLLAMVLRFAHETGLPLFDEACVQLTSQLLDLYDTDSIFGFVDLERDTVHRDSPCLLTGATGIAMVLLAAGSTVPPDWDRMFLLS